MNIRILKQNVAMLCISLVFAVSVQPAIADHVLPDPELVYETELSLQSDPGNPDKVITLGGTVHQGGPFTLRSYHLTIPGESGGNEFLVASYARTAIADEIQVTITAGDEVYSFINFLGSREEVDDFLDRYVGLYNHWHGNGGNKGIATTGMPGRTVAERMMRFFIWLDEKLLLVEDREYGFAQKLAWMQSDTYQQFAPHAAGLLMQVLYAPESEVDNAWVKSLTFQDLVLVFDYPVKRVLDQDIPMPIRNEMESFVLGVVASQTDQPPGGGGWDWGFDDYYDCWNQTWSGAACRACCSDWYSMASAVCVLVLLVNPVAGLACELAASTGYMYCRLGCGLANPGGEEWSGGA